MTRGPTATAAGEPSRWAFAGLVLLGLVAWTPVIGVVGALRMTPLAALAFGLATATRPRVASFAAMAFVPATWLVAGLAPALVAPWRWAELGGGFAGGLSGLCPARFAAEAVPFWPRAVIAGLVAVCWFGGAAAARRREPRGTRTAGFLCLVTPVALAVIAEQSAGRAELGAAVVALGILWFRPRHVGRGAGVPTAMAAGVFALLLATVAGPSDPWLGASEVARTGTAVRGFDPGHTYGPLTETRDGTTMLRVRARTPAYWRAQVLARVDGRGWHASALPEPVLPQPAARGETVEVEVRALQSRLVFAPGEVVRVDGAGGGAHADGPSYVFQSPPAPGGRYRVTSEVTQASPAALYKPALPASSTLLAYTTVELDGRAVQVPLLGSATGSQAIAVLERSPYRQSLALARRLALGARTQLDVVNRVEHYLARGFRYETDVQDGARPLDEFLFRRRTGYCQHFSGAAALLLRLAGVPSRVVTGFAPGVYDRRTRSWRVRDLDAHSWVEVYFAGVGWIVMDPTPSAGPAAVPPAAELIGPHEQAGPAPIGVPGIAVALGCACASAIVIVRRRRRGDPDLQATMLLRTIASRASTPPRGATYAELGRELERACGAHTARLAEVLERRRFSSAPFTGPRLRLRTVWRALRLDRGLVCGSYLTLRALSTRDDAHQTPERRGATS